MNSPKFVSLLIVPDQPNPVRLAGSGDALRDAEGAGLIAWQAQEQLGLPGEPPMWDTYVRVRDVVSVLNELRRHAAISDEKALTGEDAFSRGGLAAYRVAQDRLLEVLQ